MSSLVVSVVPPTSSEIDLGVVVDIAPNLYIFLLKCRKEEGHNDVGAGDKSNNCNYAEFMITGMLILRTCRADDQEGRRR